MKRVGAAIAVLVAAGIAWRASGQAMPGMEMPGMTMPVRPPAASMPGMAMPAPGAPVGTEPPPPVPTDHAADRFYDPAAMAAARRVLHDEHGGMRTSMLLFNLAEVQLRRGRDGVRWDGEAWVGGDIDRLEITTEGDATRGRAADEAELQLLFSHAIDPYFNLRGGARQDFGTGTKRRYLTAGVEGLAPYWLNVEAAAFLSDRGRVSARLKADYDQRITQRLIVQPRAELNLSGKSDVELGVRARYEIGRAFAPYIGVNWLRRAGSAETSLVSGVRFWF